MSVKDLDRRNVEALPEVLRWDAGTGADEAREIETLVSLLRSLPDPEPSTDLTARIMQRVMEMEAKPRLLRPVFGRLTASRATAALAAGIACAAIGIQWQATRAPEPLEMVPRIAQANTFTVGIPFGDPRRASLFGASAPDAFAMPVAVAPAPNLLDLRLDAQLNELQLDPQGFFRRLERVRERDRFVQRLAERAARRGDAAQVALNVRAVAHPLARPMVDQFLHASLVQRVSGR